MSKEVGLEPLYDRIVCEVIKEEKSDGGLWIPTTSQGKDVRKCTVIAVGPGKRHMDTGEHFALSLVPGDTIIVDPMKCSAVKISRGVEYMVTREEDVVGKLTTNK
jgi:chaperonin GroES